MTTEEIDFHFKLLGYAMPVCNVLVLTLWVYGAIRSHRFRTGFVVMACASALWTFPQLFEGVLRAQKDFGEVWLSKDVARSLLPLSIISCWAAFPFHFVGLVMVLRQAAKSNEQNGSSPP
jgi:hypothetical protein